jgi:hypothetical protein
MAGALALLLLPACAHQQSAAKQTKPDQPKQLISPLTGMPIQDENHPLMMVMINNHQKARPQTGLDRADVVVEMLAEGEITRFAAFYYNDLHGTVGPVRSIRDYYLDLSEGAHAVVVHAGGATDALERIKQEHVPDLDGIHQDERDFTRVSFRKAPHNLYARLEDLVAAAKKKGYALQPQGAYRFSQMPATENGHSAEKIHLVYNSLYSAGYEYDSASQSYIRYTEGVRQVDRETGQPLSMQNVLVIFARHQIMDAVGHRSVAVKGAGKGFLFQKGKGIPIEWKFENGWIVPYQDGKEIGLIPGKTWVNVLPETGKVTYH